MMNQHNLNQQHYFMKLLLVLVLFISLLPAAEATTTILGVVYWSDDSLWSSTDSVTDRTIDVADTEEIKVSLYNPYTSGSITYTVEARSIATGRVVDTFTETIPSMGGSRRVSVGQGSSYDINIPTDDHYDYTFQLSARQSGSTTRVFGPARLHFVGNRAPVLSVPSSSYTIDERETITFDVTGTDADNDELELVMSSAPLSGSTLTTVTDTAGRIVKRFSWTPSLSQAGVYNINFRVSDDNLIDGEMVTITVIDNAAPSVTAPADGATFSVTENSVLTVDINANDANADPITYEAYQKRCRFGLPCTHISLPSSTFNSGTGVLTFSPGYDYVEHPDASVADLVYFRAYDGVQYSVERSMVITTNDRNQLPIAISRTVTVDEDVMSAITLTGSDADPEDEEEGFSFGVVELPTHGLLSGTEPHLQFTPELNYNGADRFTFQVTDQMGGPSLVGTITINVRPTNDAPDAVNDAYTIDEDITTDFNVLSNDRDADTGDVLTIASSTNGVYGTTTIVSGKVRYDPANDYFGTDAFTYTIRDVSGAMDTATVTVTIRSVNDAPILSIPDITYLEDSGSNNLDLTAYASDVDHADSDLFFTVVSQTRDSVVHCSMTSQSNVACTPRPNQSGTSTVTIQASDLLGASSLASTDSFVITVTSVDDAAIANADAYTINEDTLLSVAASGVLANDNDVDGGSFSVTASDSTSTRGAPVVVNANGSFTYDPQGRFDDLSVTESAMDSFTYTITGGSRATVTITVTGENDAPVANDISATTDEDSTVGVTVTSSDIEGDPITFSYDPVGTNGGTITRVESTPNLIYNPNGQFNGLNPGESATDTFTFTVVDINGGSAVGTVTVTITGLNDAPVIDTLDPTSAEIYQGESQTFVVEAHDDDIDTVLDHGWFVDGSSVGDNSNTFTYDGTDLGTYEVRVIVTDSYGLSDSASSTITVVEAPSNDPPIASDDSYTALEDILLDVRAHSGVLRNDADPEGRSLTVSRVVDDVDHGTLTLNADGSFTYLNTPDYYGLDSFVYEVSDGINTPVEATATIAVNPMNDAPVIRADSYEVDEDETLIVNAVDGVLANDDDVEGPLIASYRGFEWDGVVNYFNADGSFSFTPDKNFNGEAMFGYTATDSNGVENSVVVTITVRPMNDAPTSADASIIIPEDQSYRFSLGDFTYSDVEESSMSKMIVDTLPADGRLFFEGLEATGVLVIPTASIGQLVFTPTTDEYGMPYTSFTFSVNDGTDDSESSYTMMINVRAVGDAPVAVVDSFDVQEDTATILDVLANDYDVDGDSLKLSWAYIGIPNHGTAVVNADNTVVIYTPDADYSGPDSFTYNAIDSNNRLSNEATVYINVVLPADTEAPLITLLGDAEVTFVQGEDYTDAGATAFDTRDGDITANIVTFNPVDTAVVDDYTVTYNVADAAGNAAVEVTRSVHVVLPADTEGPLITLLGDAEVTFVQGEDYTDAGATAFDTRDGDITANIVTFNPVDTAVVDDYTVTYNVADAAGNAAVEVTRSVHVVLPADTEAPLITLLGDNPQELMVGDTYVELGATVTDNVDVGLVATIDVSAVDTSTAGSYPVTYNAVDSSGNLAVEVTRMVNVNRPNTPPVANPQSITIDEDSSVSIALTGSDADSDPLTFMIVDGPIHGELSGTAPTVVYTPNSGYSGPDSFSFSVSDGSIDSLPAAVDITVIPAPADTTAPVITINGPTTIIIEEGTTYVDAGATAVDNVDGSVAVTTTVAPGGFVDTSTPDTYTVTYTTVDSSGNAATATRTVIVDQNTAPEIASEPDTTAIIGEEWVYEVVVEDDSPVTITVDGPEGMVIEDGVVTWTPDEIGSEEVTITVMDGQFTVTQTFVITIEKARNDIKIMKVSLPEDVMEGSLVPVRLFLQNKGTKDLSDARITVQMPELGIKRSSRAFNMDAGDSRSGTVNIQLPYTLEARDYLVKITLSNDHFHESVYRYVYVVN